MQIRDFRKKFFRTIFSISIIFIFSTDVVLPKNNTLKLIKDYLGDIRTLQARFSQTDYMGEIMTLIFDPKNSGTGPLTYPLSYTPLGFLIKNDLSSLISENSESFELDDLIFLKIRNPQYQLSIEFNKSPVSITGWEFKNQMGEMIKIRLKDMRKNNYISDEIFKTEKDYERFKK